MRDKRAWTTIAIVGAATFGLILGWTAGSITTCGTQCGFDVNLFEAIGTWVGGVVVASIGTVFGLYSARRNARLDKEARERQEREDRDRQEQRAHTLATMCSLRFQPKMGSASRFDRAHVTFENKLDDYVFNPTLRGPNDEIFQQDDQVAPARIWGTTIPLSSLGLDQPFENEAEARQALNANGVKAQISFEFTIHGYRFIRNDSTLKVLGATAQGSVDSV